MCSLINNIARPIFLALFSALIVSGCGVDGGGGSSTSTLHPIDRTDPPENEGNTGDVFFTFVEEAGLDRQFNTAISEMTDMAEFFSGGLAAADYDADGDVDLYVAGGKSEPNHLFENQGDGKFIDVANSRGVDLLHWGSGPAFSDVDGDGESKSRVRTGAGVSKTKPPAAFGDARIRLLERPALAAMAPGEVRATSQSPVGQSVRPSVGP